MIQHVTLPDWNAQKLQGHRPGGWWHREQDRIVCDLCPRACVLKEGDRGFCFVRQNLDGEMILTTYGRSTGFCIDPIEKKPLNHFYPGTSVLSFGTAGCNLGCKFCQNWDISKSREIERLSASAMPEHIARACKQLGCHSVAFTYNDPVIWAEYAMETAAACHAVGVKTVAVTAGYITPEARGPFFDCIDAANVDLKAFTEEFYHKITLSHLEPILDTLRWIKAETDVWLEITNLIIPEANDNTGEFRRMCDWILENVGDEVPLHFTAFHPDFRMLDTPNTPPETLIAAREIAMELGLKYVYVGNVRDVARQSTYCPGCRNVVIERDWHALGKYALAGNLCTYCGHEIAGFFADKPGNWGRRRQPIDMRRFLPPESAPETGPELVSLRTGTSNSAAARNVLEPAGPSRSAFESPTTGFQMERSATMTDVSASPATVSLHSAAQKDALLRAAGEILKSATLGRPVELSDPTIAGLAELTVWGVFVTVKRNGHLRSCCGSFGRAGLLRDALQAAAVRTATDDPRFPALSASELPHLHVDVWLLHEPEEVDHLGEARVEAVEVGVHGLQIVKGNQRGLLLPGVPVDAGWDRREFLNRVCIKASLPPTAWREDDSKLIRFRGECAEAELGAVLGLRGATLPRPVFSADQIHAYNEFGRELIASFIAGRTPNAYLSSVPDADVSGVALTVALPGTNVNHTLWRLAIRGKNPTQTTLSSLCQEIAGILRQRGLKPDHCGRLQVHVTIFDDPAMHGTVEDSAMEGILSSSRSVLVRERNRTAWIFDKCLSPNELLAEAAQMAEVSEPKFAAIYSFGAVSSTGRVTGGSVPRPVAGDDVRRPSVAGKFYPGQPAEASRMLNELLGERVPRERWSGALLPHAGWKFSGKIAADVLKSIEFPKNIIVIGPKHTPLGVEWAVAPHLVWGLPTGNLGSNERMAKALAAAIPGLQLDAAAHRQEHGIEVELPLIQRLAPASRVVGIVLGAATPQRCEEFAKGLAEVIRKEEEPPLLLISSDMNHYATDAENRRLDELAMEKLEQLDADGLLEACTANHISMCGLRPAVVVLKTLQALGRLSTCRRVSYATSADVTGDTSRVVGYSGMLFR